jgi:small GTP-binding protein
MVNIKESKRKICLIGDWGVGKTSLIRKFVLDQFDDKYIATFGSKVTKKRIKYKITKNDIIDLNLMIWDIMGQHEFKKARIMGYRGTKGAFLVCDITRKETLDNISKYHEELFSITQDIPIIVLANKVDLKKDAKFSPKDLKEVANKIQAPYFSTSAKTGENVKEAFFGLGEEMIRKYL